MSTAYYIMWLVIGLVCAAVCYIQAKRKGYSPILFGILGFFFSLITLIVVLVIPKKTA